MGPPNQHRRPHLAHPHLHLHPLPQRDARHGRGHELRVSALWFRGRLLHSVLHYRGTARVHFAEGEAEERFAK